MRLVFSPGRDFRDEETKAQRTWRTQLMSNTEQQSQVWKPFPLLSPVPIPTWFLTGQINDRFCCAAELHIFYRACIFIFAELISSSWDYSCKPSWRLIISTYNRDVNKIWILCYKWGQPPKSWIYLSRFSHLVGNLQRTNSSQFSLNPKPIH